MRRTLAATLFVVFLFTAVATYAQNPNYNVGSVWRVTYIHIKVGQGDVFWNDIRQHLKPIWDEQKKQGLISDYKLYTNPVLNSPSDWTVAVALLYPNWGALDQLAAKAESIAAQHYGSRDAMLDAARKRNEFSEAIASHLAREVMLK